MMLTFRHRMLITVVLLLCAINGGELKQIPEYLQVCKRVQSTIDSCVKNSVEHLRPHLLSGIPELKVPSIEPLYIPEIVIDSGDLINFKAIGKDVKVYGVSNFTLKRISVNLDTFTIRGQLRFPKLHFDGLYEMDARLIAIPIKGKGKLIADAVKCEAEFVFYAQVIEKNNLEYINFTKAEVDINVKDYKLKLDGLFNGDKVLGQATNEAINQNRAELLNAMKPYAEKTIVKIFLRLSNVIASTFPLDDLLPKP